MTNNPVRLIAFFTAAGMFMLTAAKAGVAIDVGDYSLVAADGGLGGYKAFPDICRLQDGRLMTVFYDGYGHISPPNSTYPNGGRISYVTSNDEGETWSPLGVLYDTPADDRDPQITQLPDGRLLCGYFNIGSGAYLVSSNDAGSTWSSPSLLTDSYYVSSPVRRMSDGKLVEGLYYEPGDGTAHGAVTTSNDNGYTWTTPVDIPNPSGAYLDAETDVIELTDGTLWAVQRSSHSPAQYATSVDGGATWSESQPLDFVAHCPYLLRTEHNNVILMGYRGYYSLDGWGPGFTGLRYSLDECRTWSEAIEVDSVIGAYPSMVNLNDGSVFFTYYEEGGGSNIRGRRLVISDVPDPVVTDLLYEDVYEDFEGTAPGTPVNTLPGWSGSDQLVISDTLVDQGQSAACSAGADWPVVSKAFTYDPVDGDRYIFTGTLWADGVGGDYAHAQLKDSSVTTGGARMHVALGYGDLVFGYLYEDETYSDDVRVPQLSAPMDFMVVLSGSSFDAYWRLNGDSEWIDVGRVDGGIDAANFDLVGLAGHGGYDGGVDSLRLTVESLPAHPGDANRDGKVDGDDAAILAANWQTMSDARWGMGDFNEDGMVDDKDAAIMAANWRYGVGQASASVPEPGTRMLLAGSLLALIIVKMKTIQET